MASRAASPAWIEALRASEEVNQLVYALSLAERFYFAMVVVSAPIVATALLDALVERVSKERGSPIRMVRLDPHEGYNSDLPIPFERVVDQALAPLVAPPAQDKAPGVVFVVDASRASPHDYAWGTMFQRMNERRNTIVKALDRPLLLCMPPWLERVFAQNAPDFWSIGSLALVVKAAPPKAEESAPAKPARSWLLSEEEIHAVFAAAISAGLAPSPATLLVGIDTSFRESIPMAESSTSQLLLTLHRLNETVSLSDGTVPLRVWLQNAQRLAGFKPAADVFQRALDKLSRQGL